jgi:hypothetical protein
MTSGFEGLFQTQDETLEKILLLMLDDSKGLPMKTDIANPLNLSRLETIAFVFRQDGYTEVAEVLEFFVLKYRVNRVSFNRKSRSEIIQAIEGLKKEERSLADKLLSRDPKE